MRTRLGAQRIHWPRLLTVALLLAVLLLVLGCSTGDPQNTFSPEGDVAERQRDLFNLVLWPAVVILILVEGLLVYAVLRFRRRTAGELPAQVHGNTRLELAWTIAPAILLLFIAVPTVDAIIDLGRAPAAGALQVRVTGIQWRWQFEYMDIKDSEGKPLTVFDELHIPVDKEIGAHLEALDVIHSFWVPKLAGKLDVIPGRGNRMWFNATKPGTYSGQCAEFCGLGHADMRLRVVAESEEDFQAWVDDQLNGGGSAGAAQGAPDLVSGGE
ncbi:MAG TPA: cytochrome c oxidase subunit II [Dehalococcoidia bacterium]|nr:cytochrome c oxidase subunit II [Dehalococcoidia bacterium]